jgi:diphthamide biosynthesis methyltransferase
VCTRKVKKADCCYLPLSIVQEELYGKEIIVADREMVEERADQMLAEALEFDVAFLVVGDPFG